MRYSPLLLMVLYAVAASAQKITGVVLDKTTQQAIAGATVAYKSITANTRVTGLFEIDARNLNDTLKVTEIGYKPYKVFIDQDHLNIRIELETNTIALKDVDIFGTHNFKQDSLANRADYAKQFNYTPPKLKDIVGLPTGDRPGQLLTIDLISLVKYLTYKGSSEYKFKNVLIKDEHEQFVDEKFNRGLVARITDLKADKLTTFLTQYRPTYQFVLKATIMTWRFM